MDSMGRERAIAERAQSIAASGRREGVTWKLYVEHKLKPPVKFYDTKRHSIWKGAFQRALAFFRHPGGRLRVLYIEGSNGERIEAATIDEWCERAPPDVTELHFPPPWSVDEAAVDGNLRNYGLAGC